MSKTDFFRKLVRYIFLMLIAIIVIALGNNVVTAKDCSICPGKGVCNGKEDCDKF